MLKIIFSTLPKNHSIARKIICCDLHTSRFYGTFKYEILDYFEKTSKIKKSNPFQTFSDSDPKNIEAELNSTTEDKLEAIYKDFATITALTDEELSKEFLEDLDIKCFSIIHSIEPTEILNFFHEFHKILKYKFKFLYFYDKSLPLLIDAIENNLLSNHETVQVLFFISLNGEKNAHYIKNLLPYLPDLNDLPLIEKCIVAEAFYQTSVKLQPRQLRLVEKVVGDNFETLIESPNLLEALCQAIIFSEPSDELFKNLSKAVLNCKKPMNFNNNAHVLHLYAKALIFEPQVIDKLVKNCIFMIDEDLKESKNNLSIKSLDMFLWSISNLGLTLTLPEKLILRKFVETRFAEYRTKENLSYLVNSLLCLNMLRCWSMKVIKLCFQERLFLPIVLENYSWKVKSRFKLLMTVMDLEMKLIIPKILKRNMPTIGYKTSDNVNKVANVVQELIKKGIVNKVIIECPIEAITLPGVTLHTDKEIYHVDVLDDLTCLRNTNMPHGLMNLKLRLLSRLRYRQILINGNIFKENPEKTLSIIQDKIEKRIHHGKSSTICSEETFEKIH